MKRIVSLLLSILLLLSLLSCGGEMPADEPNTPAAPETPSPETAVAPEEKYPVQVPCEYGLIYPVVEQESLVKIVSDRETLDAYRQEYDAIMLDQFRFFFREYPDATDHFLPMLLTHYVNASNAFAICDKEDFFEHNTIILVSVPKSHVDISVDCSIVSDDGNRKLSVDIIIVQKDFGTDDPIASANMAISVPNSLGIDMENDVIVNKIRK